ncbi:MAG: HNH endonuclease [Calditrichaeota bacterium]|nr:MAG: HNH endonuclease [Calditrichota bacterium]
MKSNSFSNLSINSLAQSLKQTTNSYKFYWLLSIIEQLNFVDFETKHLSTKDIVARMIAKIWYPINHHNLSFGKQDKLGEIVNFIKMNSEITIKDSEEVIFEFLKEEFQNPKSQFKKLLKDLQRYVPFRFLTPWFKFELQGIEPKEKRIKELSSLHFLDSNFLPLYRFLNTEEQIIEMSPYWIDYLKNNQKILADFCYWNLVNYLQTKNPNTPNIAFKLFMPKERDLRKARYFWSLVLKKDSNIHCIYSGFNLNDNFTIDHFVPWSFVAHDKLWNLIPTSQIVNSQKGNSIPSLESYLTPFIKTQFETLKFFINLDKEKKILEDYAILFDSDFNSMLSMSFSNFKTKLEDTIKPLCQIASNNGFQMNWKFKN